MSQNANMKLITNLKIVRKRMGYTQASFTRECKIFSLRHYQEIESGRILPSKYTAILISKILHTPVEELFPQLINDNCFKKTDP